MSKRGGKRQGSGRKPKWNTGETQPVRVPKVLQEEILLFAQLVDHCFADKSNLPSEKSLKNALRQACQDYYLFLKD